MRGPQCQSILLVDGSASEGTGMPRPKARRNGAAKRPARAKSKRRPPSGDRLRERIASDPAVCSGKPCVRGTRIPVHIVLDLLAADESVENILAAYPNIARDDVRACILHAAELAEEEAGVSS